MAALSIILPSFNHAEFLPKRLNTILHQTYNDWELIIIDDCSTDNSVQILTDFVNQNQSKVKHFIVNETNSGSGYNSWKKGIELANSKYIWIAETDDYSATTFLEELINILESNNEISLAFSGSNYVENNNVVYESSKRTLDLNVPINSYQTFEASIFLDKLPFQTYVTNGSSVVFRKPTIPIPNELFSHKQSSDIFLWTFLVENNSFAFLNKNLNFFRRHENATTVKMNANSLKAIYIENCNYLNYFKQSEKFQQLLNHYIKYYVWNNKNQLFKYHFLKKVNHVNYVTPKYFLSLLKFIFKKVTQ
jgi:glycosyltransferase involved in cell wall biosynthesis